MGLRLQAAMTALAVSVAEVKANSHITTASEDALIESMIYGAMEMAETLMGGRAIMPQTWDLTLDNSFPCEIELTRIPVASVSYIKYIAEDGTLTTLDPSQYVLDASSDFSPAIISPAYNVIWPTTRVQRAAVQVRFVAGYADAAAVPKSIKDWLLLAVGWRYDNREASAKDQQYALRYAEDLLSCKKVY